MFDLTRPELATFKKLSTPIKIQDFLDTFPINWEKNGETYMSPRRTLREKKMHCLEGALIAATALWLKGEKPLLLDLKAPGKDFDDDHVVALYTRNGYWGAISKTNHAALRFRDPVYKTLRELVLSYFHEYFDNDSGKKILRAYSKPFDLSLLGHRWITTEDDLYPIAEALDDTRHYSLFPKTQVRLLRNADTVELTVGKHVEWAKHDPRT